MYTLSAVGVNGLTPQRYVLTSFTTGLSTEAFSESANQSGSEHYAFIIDAMGAKTTRKKDISSACVRYGLMESGMALSLPVESTQAMVVSAVAMRAPSDFRLSSYS